MSHLKAMGRIYRQTFVDAYAKGARAKLYTTNTPMTAADLLNDRVLSFVEEHGITVERVLTDRGTEFCGRRNSHPHELLLAVSEIDHTKTKAKIPQTKGIRERFGCTELEEFYQVTFRKKIYRNLEELQTDLDQWLRRYNQERAHQGKMHCGRKPLQTYVDVRGRLERQTPRPRSRLS